MTEKNPATKKKREDVKVDPDLKFDLQLEAQRLDVFDYQIAEAAIREFLAVTAALPKAKGLSGADVSRFEVLELIAEILRDGSPSQKRNLLASVESWKRIKTHGSAGPAATDPVIPGTPKLVKTKSAE
jgi:hypothetical protein